MIIDPITVTLARHEIEAVLKLIRQRTMKQHNAALEMAEDRLLGAVRKPGDLTKEEAPLWSERPLEG